MAFGSIPWLEGMHMVMTFGPYSMNDRKKRYLDCWTKRILCTYIMGGWIDKFHLELIIVFSPAFYWFQIWPLVVAYLVGFEWYRFHLYSKVEFTSRKQNYFVMWSNTAFHVLLSLFSFIAFHGFPCGEKSSTNCYIYILIMKDHAYIYN